MSPEASELCLYADNDEPLYRQKMYIFRALAKKKDRGQYDPKLAPKAFAGLVDLAAKKYVKEFASPRDSWNRIFPPESRREAAVNYAEEFIGWYEVDYQVMPPPKGKGKKLRGT